MAMGQTDLKWVLSNNEVSMEVRGVIYQKGQSEVRDALNTGFALDVGESLAMRAQVSRLFASWDAARLQVNQTSCAQRIRISSDVCCQKKYRPRHTWEPSP
eukprot:12116322-Karenia_brevis.AAC.1